MASPSIEQCLIELGCMNINQSYSNTSFQVQEDALIASLKCGDMTNVYYYKVVLLHSTRAWNFVGTFFSASDFSALPNEFQRNSMIMYTVIDAAVRQNNTNLVILLVEDWYECILWSALEHSNYHIASICIEWQHPKDMPKHAHSKLLNRAMEMQDSQFLSLMFYTPCKQQTIS